MRPTKALDNGLEWNQAVEAQLHLLCWELLQPFGSEANTGLQAQQKFHWRNGLTGKIQAFFPVNLCLLKDLLPCLKSYISVVRGSEEDPTLKIFTNVCQVLIEVSFKKHCMIQLFNLISLYGRFPANTKVVVSFSIRQLMSEWEYVCVCTHIYALLLIRALYISAPSSTRFLGLW